MSFKTGNRQFDILMGRARAKNNTANALKQENINVDTLDEIESKKESQESENNEESKSLDIGGVSSSSGIGIEPAGVSQSIADANEMMDVAGVGRGQTAGQVAFGLEQAAGQKSFMETNPVGAALTGYYDSALAQGIVNTAPAVAAYAGNIEAAKALGTVSNVLGSPVTGLISGIIGPSMQDPYGQTVAMGSGLLGKVSSSLMSTHYGVADEVAKGTPGYGQGYFGGSLVSVEPGIFGGLTYSGVNVPDVHVMSPTAFMEAVKNAEQAEDEAAVTGELGVNEISLQNTYGFNDNAMSDVAQNGGSVDIGFNSKGQAYSINANNSFTHSNGVTTNVTDRQGNPINAPDTDDNNNDDGSQSAEDQGGVADAQGGVFSAEGGRIGMQMGGDPSQQQAPTGEMGFIGGPPDQFTEQQTIADDIPKTVPKGAFVINAPAVEFAGKEDIKQMLIEAYEIMAQADTDAGIDRTAQAAKIPSKEQVDIMISRGEVVVPPEIAKVIGYDRLEKINNRGKKEVSRRQEESQQQEKPQARQVAEGGFIGMQEGGNVEDDFGVTIENVKFKNFYSSPQIARKEIDKILNELPLEDALAIAMEGEADVLGDEGLEGVGHVFRNRAMAEGYKDFGNTLVEELGKKTYGKNKIFQFNALEPTKFRKTLNRFKQNKDRYLKVRNIAEDIVAGSRKDFTGGALFFKNPSSSEAEDFKAKVSSGEYVETGRTVNPKNKVFAHIYYKPKDFKVTDEMPTQVEESFVSVNNDDTQPPRKIPESTGGSFLGRGSAYETGGARPAFR